MDVDNRLRDYIDAVKEWATQRGATNKMSKNKRKMELGREYLWCNALHEYSKARETITFNSQFE